MFNKVSFSSIIRVVGKAPSTALFNSNISCYFKYSFSLFLLFLCVYILQPAPHRTVFFKYFLVTVFCFNQIPNTRFRIFYFFCVSIFFISRFTAGTSLPRTAHSSIIFLLFTFLFFTSGSFYPVRCGPCLSYVCVLSLSFCN